MAIESCVRSAALEKDFKSAAKSKSTGPKQAQHCHKMGSKGPKMADVMDRNTA